MTTSSPTCAHCGYTSNKPEFRFCRGCGTPFSPAARSGSGTAGPTQKTRPHVISQQASGMKTPPANGARHKLFAYVAVVGIALVLPTSILLLFLQSRNLPSSAKKDEQVVVPTALDQAAAKPIAMSVPSSTPLPTNSPLPSLTPQPTSTPEPSSTPAPTPTPTPVPITAPGSVLENGEIWYGNGVALLLKVTRMDTDKVWVEIYLENGTSGQIFGEINPSMFRLRGPLGTAEILPSRTSWVPRTGSDFTGEKTFTLKRQGERFVIAQHAYFAYDLVAASVKELYIDVVGLPGIDSATWKIIVRQ